MKHLLLQQAKVQLDEQLALAKQSADQAQASASHEQSKPENQYDTLALEAAYLAHGQSERALQLQQEMLELDAVNLADFDEDTAIANGALVLVEQDSGQGQYFFILPCAGGLKLDFEQQQVLTLTPQSPLGQKLMGQYVGDEYQFNQQNNQIVDVY